MVAVCNEIKTEAMQMPIAKIREYARLYLEGEHTTDCLQPLENHKKSIRTQRENLEITEKMLENKIIAYKDSLKSK